MRYEFVEDETEAIEPAQQKVIPSEKSKKIAESAKFFGWKPKAETIEKIRKPLIQKLVTPATEFVTSPLGFIGDVASLVHKGVGMGTEAAFGEEPIEYEDSPLSKLFATSEMLHKGFETLAGEKLRPETLGEEVLTTGMGFLGNLIGVGGGKGLGKGKVPFTKKLVPGLEGMSRYVKKDMPAVVRNTLAAFVPASALVGAKKADLPPWAQASAAIGASLLTHRVTGQSLKEINNAQYAKVDKMAENVMLPSEWLEGELKSLEGQLSGELTTGPIGKIRSLIDEVKGKASGGAFKLSDLIKWRKNVIDASKEFSKPVLAGSQKYWKGLRQSFDNTISKYGKYNPEFNALYRESNSLYRGLKESRAIENFIKKNKVLSGIAGGAGGIVLKLLKSAVGMGPLGATATAKAFLFGRAMVRNPGLRKAWKDVLINASKEEVRGTARALKNFNQKAEKENLEKKESKSRFEFVE